MVRAATVAFSVLAGALLAGCAGAVAQPPAPSASVTRTVTAEKPTAQYTYHPPVRSKTTPTIPAYPTMEPARIPTEPTKMAPSKVGPYTVSNLGTSGQIIVVEVPNQTSTDATFSRFEKVNNVWVQVGPTSSAKVGEAGIEPAQSREQGSNKTPAGTFSINQTFGFDALTGMKLPYQQVDSNTYWPYDPSDPSTYNVLQTSRGPGATWRTDPDWSEHLIDYGQVYRYGAVVGYNLPSATHTNPATGAVEADRAVDVSKGGGIFLHVTSGRPTAGCIAVDEVVAKQTLLWLDAAQQPKIVIGTTAMLEKS